MKRLTIGEMACLCSAESGRRPEQVLQVTVSTSCLYWNAPRSRRRGRTPPKRCPEVGTTGENPAPSWTVAASSLMVGAKAVGYEWYFAGVSSSRKAPDRDWGRLDRLEGLRGTATRRNASNAVRMVIWVIAWIVG